MENTNNEMEKLQEKKTSSNFTWPAIISIWFFIGFVMNGLGLIAGIAGLVSESGAGIYDVLDLVSNLIVVVGLAMLLFNKKKIGFYLIAGLIIVLIILCILAGDFVSVIADAVYLLILCFVVKKYWSYLN